ncbi:hypothetical protein OG225_11225 [Nocardia sp. NBC_01377]|uniref:DUF6764 family protein n=1 Tax=Nocardia sp. NBC_01377 TaxID=2903595 RepID=UPI00325099EF
MRFIGAILCSTAAVGASLTVPAAVATSAVHCTAEFGADDTIVDGDTGCRAVGDEAGQAHAAGYGGVGYARATLGASSLGVGIAGGVGASEGSGGVPLALGFGPDAMASSSVTDDDPADGAARAVAIAFFGSRAQVGAVEGSVQCLGAGAIAWDEGTGATCVGTPFGTWASLPR